MSKKILAILCTVVILSFSCIFTPTSKAMKMQQIQIEMEAEASSGIIVGGVTLLAVVCIVLLWYGVSVSTDSTEAQSCLEFVKEKAEDVGISAAMLALNAYCYMYQIGEWVAEWVSSWSEAYVTSSVPYPFVGSISSDNTLFRFDWPGATTLSLDGYAIEFASGSFSNPVYFSFCRYSYGSALFMITNSSTIPGYKVFTPDSCFNDYRKTYDYSYGNIYAYYICSDSRFPSFQSLLSAYGVNLSASSLPFWQLDFGADFADIPISADVNKEVVIPAAKDVYDSLGNLDDYQLDNPDVIDFGSALSQLQSTTGNPSLTWDDVIDGVNTGAISVSDVLDATDTVPYVLTDSRTGELADADTPAEYVKPVALTDDLAIPDAQTIADSEPYTPRYDDDSDSTKKFRLPLFQYFPFCLPWDIYEVLSSFDADPVAPVLEIPIGKSFRSVPGVTAEATGYVMKLDLGEEQYAKWFRILRLLECIGIIVGFVLIARTLIHGGN